MTQINETAGEKILHIWEKINKKPGGKWLFKQIIARNIPYSGSIKADVKKLQPGHCEVVLKYRKANNNHLNSIHALAFSNLGELTSGLAMMTGLPTNIRGIPTNINTEYLKKARGNLKAIAVLEIPKVTAPKTNHLVTANIYDSSQDLVTTVTVKWLLSPKK